jgi:hypothetical protein
LKAFYTPFETHFHVNMSTLNTSEDTQCQTKTKNGAGPLCTNKATVIFNSKCYCKMHGTKLGWKPASKSEPEPAPTKPKASATKAVPPKSATKAPPKPKVEVEEEETEVPAGMVKKPAPGKHGTCTSHKATGTKAQCDKPAKFLCEGCDICGDQEKCGMHWNSVHKGHIADDTKKTSNRKEVADDKKCSHNKKTGDKGPCGRPACGTDSNGQMACFTHGGPKKADVSSSGSSSSGSSVATTGPFTGVNWPLLSSQLFDLTREHYAGSDGEPTALSEAINWLNDLIKMFIAGQPETQTLLEHFVKSGWSVMQDCEYIVAHKHTMLFVLREALGEVSTNWLVRMYGNLSKEAGDEAAEVATIWTAAAKECGIDISVSSAPVSGSGSSTKGAAIVSSNRKPTTQKLIEKARAAKVANANKKAKQEEAQEPEEEVSNANAPVNEEVIEFEDEEPAQTPMDVDSDSHADEGVHETFVAGEEIEFEDEDFEPVEEQDE